MHIRVCIRLKKANIYNFDIAIYQFWSQFDSSLFFRYKKGSYGHEAEVMCRDVPLRIFFYSF